MRKQGPVWLQYFGGKWRIAPNIIRYFPPHDTYVEPFGGAASVLIQKKLSPYEVYNDLDDQIFNFFRVLREQPEELIRQLRLTPWSRKEFEINKEITQDPLENARRFFAGCFMSISCAPFALASGFSTESFYGQKHCSFQKSFQRAINQLPKVLERLSKVVFECRPYDYILLRYDSLETLFYCDPPYLQETRTHKNGYLKEFTKKQHIELAGMLHVIRGMAIVSGYSSDLYYDLYDQKGWKRIEFKNQTNSGKYQTECLWLCPKTQARIVNLKQLVLGF